MWFSEPPNKELARMKTLGTLDESRLAFLPPRHWKAHEFCFFLHDNLVRLLIEYESSGAHNGDFQERCHSLAAFQAAWINCTA